MGVILGGASLAMARALIAVGALLALAFGVLGVVVFATRDEDRVAVDNLLALELTRAIGVAERGRRGSTCAGWPTSTGTACSSWRPGTPREAVSDALGSEYKGDAPVRQHAARSSCSPRGAELARFADYRGRATFTGFERPLDVLPRDRAVLACATAWSRRPMIGDADLSLDLSKQEAEARLRRRRRGCSTSGCGSAGRSAGEIGPPLCVVFEGWDASGKGGAIKRLVDPLDPRHVARRRRSPRRRPTSCATTGSRASGRCCRAVGGMAVLDRSWYGRVLVERVEGFASKRAWRRAYDEINALRADARTTSTSCSSSSRSAHLRRGAAQALRGAPRRTR